MTIQRTFLLALVVLVADASSRGSDDKADDIGAVVSSLQSGNQKDIDDAQADYDVMAKKCKEDDDELTKILKEETDNSKSQKNTIIKQDANLIQQNNNLDAANTERDAQAKKAADTTAAMKEADAVYAQADTERRTLIEQVSNAVAVIEALGTSLLESGTSLLQAPTMTQEVQKVITMAQAMGFGHPLALLQQKRDSVDVKTTLINSLNDMKSKLSDEKVEADTMNRNRKKADTDTIKSANEEKKRQQGLADDAQAAIDKADSTRSEALEALNESQAKLTESYERLLASTAACQEAAKQYDLDLAAMTSQKETLAQIGKDLAAGAFMQLKEFTHIWKDQTFLQLEALEKARKTAAHAELLAFQQENERALALAKASPFKSITDLISKLIQDLHDDQAKDEAKFGQCWTDINEAKASRRDASDRLVAAADITLEASNRIVQEEREVDAARRAHKFNVQERTASIAHQKALNEWATGRVKKLTGMVALITDKVIKPLRKVLAETTAGKGKSATGGMQSAMEIFATVRSDMKTTIEELNAGQKKWKAEMWDAVKVYSKGSAVAKTKFKMSNGAMNRAGKMRDEAVATFTASQDAMMISTNSLITTIYPACADLAGNMNTGALAAKQKEAEMQAEQERKQAEIDALKAAQGALKDANKNV